MMTLVPAVACTAIDKTNYELRRIGLWHQRAYSKQVTFMQNVMQRWLIGGGGGSQTLTSLISFRPFPRWWRHDALLLRLNPYVTRFHRFYPSILGLFNAQRTFHSTLLQSIKPTTPSHKQQPDFLKSNYQINTKHFHLLLLS